jgi:predicted XRE-type DNA-binding protein
MLISLYSDAITAWIEDAAMTQQQIAELQALLEGTMWLL